MTLSRRDFLRVGSGAIALVGPVAFTGTVVAGDLVQVAAPAANPDGALLDAEREWLAVQEGLKLINIFQYEHDIVDRGRPFHEGHASGPNWDRFMALDRLITATPAKTIEGAAVKLRRFNHSFFGLWMIHETSFSNAVLSHHERLLADAIRALGRMSAEPTVYHRLDGGGHV